MSYYITARGAEAARLEQPKPVDPDAMVGQFLVRLELLRLTEFPKEGGSSSRAQLMLAKENEILRNRLSTLKENIAVLNKMIEQIRQTDSHYRQRSVDSSDPDVSH